MQTETNNAPPLVLVADDELSAATMLRHIFEREGYTVKIAQDGQSALSAAREYQPDLILLDIQMPKMNGFEVLEALRKQESTAGIPTIVVSARAKAPADIAKGLNIGADDYISKPFAPQELLARARSKMRARQLEETLQLRTQELEALLKVSDQLDRHLEINDLLNVILEMVLELLNADAVFVCRYDDDMSISDIRAVDRNNIDPDVLINAILDKIDTKIDHVIPLNLAEYGFDYALSAPLQHGANLLGILVIASHKAPKKTNQRMLFTGISQQAALALHNAELYEIQANYALHLEEIVEQRTEELKATQQMLLRSEKLASIGHLAASIAHEINNPLQPIKLNLDHIVEDLHTGHTIDPEIIEITQDSVERISRIVRQLLEFAKPSSEGESVPVDVVSVVKSVIRLNERAFHQSDISIETHIEDTPTISGNRDQLEQVFMNLMINAKAAMEEGGKFIIRVWKESGKVRLQFEDTGIGISEDMLNKIFDPFVSTKPTGTGLGLFVTFGIIEKHHGEIDVRSKEGVGTVFTITLPVEG